MRFYAMPDISIDCKGSLLGPYFKDIGCPQRFSTNCAYYFTQYYSWLRRKIYLAMYDEGVIII